ncbi:MAG: class I SAM-dependent methyltransferase [Anaerolineae bacterium]|nr:class I SAM-dependent methyltransferase [Anaerolineae bacterium]
MKEITTCAFCGSDKATVLYRGTDMLFPYYTHEHAVQQCDECGLWYLNPRPDTEEEILKMYPPEYDSYVDTGKGWFLAVRRQVWKPELRRHIALAGRDGHILEVGCATGEYLNELRLRGCRNLVGVEYNPEAVRLANERYHLDVIQGDILGGHFADQQFDLVIMRYVLEHVPNPMETLREAARILKPGGAFIFSIPNPDSLDARVYGRHWFGHEIPRHFFNYPQATLKKMLAATGFELDHIDFPYIPNDWILGFKNVLLNNGTSRAVARLVDIDNPLALALFLPLGVLSGLLRASGRMHVHARRMR